MPRLSPGVRAQDGRAGDAEAAAARAVELAEEANRRGSFGVGGLLVDGSGRVIAEAVNAVVRDGRAADPTAHVERQLVDWYYSTGRRHHSAGVEDLTIVCSLDPCAMCAGAILRAGMKAIAVAPDESAGIHAACGPDRLPKQLGSRVGRHMAFFGVRQRRPRSGADLGPLFSTDISPELLSRAETAFAGSLDRVRSMVGGGNVDEAARSAEAVPSATLLRNIESSMSMTNISFELTGKNIHAPDLGHGLARTLERDLALLVDHRGFVILGALGAEKKSPARSSILELVRAYGAIRRAARDANIGLPHQRYCSIVKRNAPEDAAKALMELGALGSFLEEPRIASALPAFGYLDGADPIRIDAFAAALPPFYSSVIGITAGRIAAGA